MEIKKNALKFGICILALAVVWGMYIIGIKKMKKSVREVIENDYSWVFQVENVSLEGEEYVMEGFAFETKANASNYGFDIILHDIETGEFLFPEMRYVKREDVNDYFLCEYDYTQSGFTAKIKEDKVNKEHVYEVLLRPYERLKAYQTGTYVFGGEMWFTNPKGFVSLDVEGTDLEAIVKDGILRVYRPDVGMYVYQYRKELYWIASKDYEFVNQDTYVQYQMITTQEDKLPQGALEKEWFWSNRSFSFSAREIKDWNTGEWRVAKSAIPEEYSSTIMWTGNYIEGWVWQEYFYPWYAEMFNH